jgi:hypothetical protein
MNGKINSGFAASVATEPRKREVLVGAVLWLSTWALLLSAMCTLAQRL